MNDHIAFVTPTKAGDLALLPCPFCGSERVVYEQYQHSSGERWRVLCLDCMAGVDPGHAQMKVDVRDLWNRRKGAQA